MDFPQRKPLRLKAYDYTQGWYFVTVCTANRAPCLGMCVGADAHIGPHIRLSGYGRIAERFIKTIPGIDAYVIMPNHVHLTLALDDTNGPMWASAPTQPLSSRIRSFKTLTGKAVGFRLWQRSFYEHAIRNEDDYLRIRQYMADNPAHWLEDKYYKTTEIGGNTHV